MTWVQQLLLGLLGGGSLGGAVFFVLWRWERGRREAMAKEIVSLKAQAADGYRQFQDSERARKDDRNRLEGVAARMRAEIDGLEFDLAACAVQLPGSVRERFNKLYALGVPSPGSDKALP